MVTVRELARSQGFPDSFVFHAISDNVVTVRSTSGCSIQGVIEFSQPDAQADRKRSSLACGRRYWPRVTRSPIEKMAQ